MKKLGGRWFPAEFIPRYPSLTTTERVCRQTNVTDVEERFQRRYSTHPLGTVRLWREVAKGRKFCVPSLAIFKTFAAVSFELQEWIRRGDVVVVP